jgi:predicted regulator of Ras-like GTPase activity (Roadblock/LC7/MglB family)
MFKEVLREIVDRTEGAIAGLLMDSSGIAVDSYAKDGAPFDISAIGVEFGILLGSIKKAAENVEAGATNEVAISTDKMITIIRVLTGDYYLALAIAPEGNFGKGRYLMRTAAPKLQAEL